MRKTLLAVILAIPYWANAETIQIDDSDIGFAAAGPNSSGAIILMYHGLNEAFGFNPESFQVQMEYLSGNGYNTITMDHLLSWIETGEPTLPEKAVVLSFDDNYITVYTVAYPILKQLGFVGVSFTHTNYVGVATGNDHCDWTEIQQMESEGVIFTESHTRTHSNLTGLSAAQLISELDGSKADIELALTDKVCRHHSYPYGGYNATVLAATAAAGYETAVTTIPGLTTRSSTLLELPRYGVNPNSAGGGTELNSQFQNAVGAHSTSGNWEVSSAVPDYIGSGYHFAYAGEGDSIATWTFSDVPAGRYEVFAHWTANVNRATDAPYLVKHADGETMVPANQQVNHAEWVSLGTYRFDSSNPPVVQLTNDADGVVVADAVRIESVLIIDSFIVY